MKLIKGILNKYNSMPITVKATFWFFVCSVMQKGISLITVPIFTRLMTTEEYGVFSTYQAWLNIFVIFTTFKLNYGVFNKGMTKYINEKDTYTSTMTLITTMLCVIFLLFYFIFRNEINSLTELSTPIILLMIAEMVFSPALSFWSLRERYEFHYKNVVFITLLLSVMNALAGVIAVLFYKEKDIARIVSCAIINIIFGLVIYIYVLKKPKIRFNKKIARFAILFNLPLIPHYLSEYVLDQSDRIMIQKLCSQTALGLYSVVYNAGLIMKIFVSSLNSALIPWLYQSLEKQHYDRIKKVIFYTCLLLAVPLLLFIIIAPELLIIFAAPQYSEAIYIIPPVAASIYFIFLFGIYGNIEFFWDENKFTMYMSMIAAGTNIILNYIGILKFGYIAAAYTTLFSYVVLSILHCIFVENISKGKIKDYVLNEKGIWIVSMLFCVAAIGVSRLYKYVFVRYIICICILVILFTVKKRIIKLINLIGQ